MPSRTMRANGYADFPAGLRWHRRDAVGDSERGWPESALPTAYSPCPRPAAEAHESSAGSEYVHFTSNARLVQSGVVVSGPVSYGQPR